MTPEQKAKQWIQENSRPNQGPCLVSKDGTCLPSCHENDFCECELKAAHIAGYRLAIEEAAKEVEETQCRGLSEWGSAFNLALSEAAQRVRALGASEESSNKTDREVDEYMAKLPESWRYRWCESNLCACMGCCNKPGIIANLPKDFTKSDWEKWIKRIPEQG